MIVFNVDSLFYVSFDNTFPLADGFLSVFVRVLFIWFRVMLFAGQMGACEFSSLGMETDKSCRCINGMFA